MTVGLALLIVLADGGCISKGKYKATLQEIEAIKADLERSKAQAKALEQQMGSLQGQNQEQNARLESTSLEVRKLTESRERERKGSEEKIKVLEQQIDLLVGQQRTLRQQFRDAKDANATLKSLVARYEKELKETPPPAAALPPPTVMPSAPGAGPKPAAPDTGGLAAKAQPAQPTPPPPAESVAPPPPKKPAPPIPKDFPAPEPAEEGWFAMIKRWLASILDWLF